MSRSTYLNKIQVSRFIRFNAKNENYNEIIFGFQWIIHDEKCAFYTP